MDGVRGRLIATATLKVRQLQLRLEVELENVNDVMNPVEIWWSGAPGASWLSDPLLG